MPPRINKIRHDEKMSNLGKSYVYRIFDLGGTVYIGKGTGNRLANQKRKFGLSGEVICYCDTEAKAFAKEIELIRKFKPYLNKHPGGNGSWQDKTPKWVREIEAMGTRKYAARMLLRFGFENLSKYLSGVQIENLWQIGFPLGGLNG
jgi:hypothetical protein